MKTELVQAEGALTVNPWNLLSEMVKGGRDVQQLRDMMDLVRQWQKDEAAKKWAEAIQLFQSKCGEVVKKNPVYGKDKSLGPQYHFAGYDDVMAVAQPILSECGIATTFDFKFEGQLMYTTCHVRVGTHVEDTTVPLAVPVIPNANETQKAGGALKYGMRYALVAALNIRVVGEDDDAQGQSEFIGAEMVACLNGLLNQIKNSRVQFNWPQYLGHISEIAGTDITKLDQIPKFAFSRAVTALEERLAPVRKKEGCPI